MEKRQEKVIKRNIAAVERTKAMYVDIERVFELDNGERKIYAKVKGFKRTIFARGDIVLAVLARIE